MSVASHRADSPARVTCAVLTISDTRTPETDTSGRAIADLLAAAGHVVSLRQIVRDEPTEISRTIREMLGQDELQVIIATGGTGLSERDTTIEAVAPMFDRPIEGFGELFRMLSYEQVGSAAMLSRAAAGVISGRAVFLLPGSEAAVRLALDKLILPEVGHVARELQR
jgi:molybdenum cofactor biosynthesis protein B